MRKNGYKNIYRYSTRTMTKGQRLHYYFTLTSDINKDIPDAEKKMITKYFTSASEAAKYLGIGRGTIFNSLNRGGVIISRPDYIVARCDPPIKRYVKVLTPAFQIEETASDATSEPVLYATTKTD